MTTRETVWWTAYNAEMTRPNGSSMSNFNFAIKIADCCLEEFDKRFPRENKSKELLTENVKNSELNEFNKMI